MAQIVVESPTDWAVLELFDCSLELSGRLEHRDVLLETRARYELKPIPTGIVDVTIDMVIATATKSDWRHVITAGPDVAITIYYKDEQLRLDGFKWSEVTEEGKCAHITGSYYDK